MNQKPWLQLSRRAILDIILVLLFLGFLEASSRVLLPGMPFTARLLYANETLIRRNVELGWALNPNVIQRVEVGGREIVYQTNSYGFRGNEPQPPIQSVFTGDSFTFGINSNTSFPDEFAHLTGARILNTAVVGYGTDQAFLSAKRAIETLRIEPKWIVYGFYQNDLIDNTINVNQYVGNNVVHKTILDLDTNQYVPASTEQNDVTAQYRKPTSADMLTVLMLRSRFLWALSEIVHAVRAKGQAPLLTVSSRQFLNRNLDNFSSYAQSRNAQFVVLHIPDKHGYLEKEIGDMLRPYCEAKAVLYLRPSLRRSDYLIDGHLSDAGAVRIGQLLADKWSQFPDNPGVMITGR